jgi:broad specificity phosphatase PhoE
MSVSRILLVRHGQTDWNASGRWQGHEQIPLNPVGEQQAAALGSYLKTRSVGAIYTSDLVRAQRTAEIAGAYVGLTPVVDARLRELHLGVLQGLTRAEIEQRYPEELAGFARDYFGYQVTNGESRSQMQTRALAAFEAAAAHPDAEEAVLVTHGGTIKVLLLRLFPQIEAVQTAHFNNTSITTVERNGGGWHLADIGMTPHFDVAPTDEDVH